MEESPKCRANLKKLFVSYPTTGWNKKVTSHLWVETFFLQSLCLKIYTIKTFKKISSWYNKNVTLYTFIFNFYVCWFIVIWYQWLISIKVLSCVPIKIKQTNTSIFLPTFKLTVSFEDPLWFTMYCNRGS